MKLSDFCIFRFLYKQMLSLLPHSPQIFWSKVWCHWLLYFLIFVYADCSLSFLTSPRIFWSKVWCHWFPGSRSFAVRCFGRRNETHSGPPLFQVNVSKRMPPAFSLKHEVGPTSAPWEQMKYDDCRHIPNYHRILLLMNASWLRNCQSFRLLIKKHSE